MATECVYRSDHPDVIGWWDDLNETRRVWSVRCTEVVDSLGYEGFTPVIADGTKSGRLVGINGRDDNRRLLPPPSPAWRRMDEDMSYYRPYRNGKKDQKILDLFSADDVVWKMPFPPGGMPLDMMVAPRSYTPGMHMIDGVLWIPWSVGQGYVDPDPDLADKVNFRKASADTVDHDVWTPAKLSEFYAAQGN